MSKKGHAAENVSLMVAAQPWLLHVGFFHEDTLD